MVSLTSSETLKGIIEVANFLRNYGFLWKNARLFSLQDELCRILYVPSGRANRFEVVSDHCERSLITLTK